MISLGDALSCRASPLKKQSTGLFFTPVCGLVPSFRIPTQIKNPVTTDVVAGFLVGVSGFEPEASWTRTKRDTKLRHTPITENIILKFPPIVKCRNINSYNLLCGYQILYCAGGSQ